MSTVDILQNATPTDWSNYDKELAARSDYDQNRFAMDKKLHVQFYMKPMLNQEKSAAAGRAIYEDTEFIRIMLPGDKQNIIDRKVGLVENERERFPEHYAKFKAGQAEQVVGTPLQLLPFLSPAQVEEYKFFNIRTVEQLAAASDSIGTKFMGFNQHKQKAQAFLDATTGAEAVGAMREELEESKKVMAAMQEQLKELTAAAAQKKVAPPPPVTKG